MKPYKILTFLFFVLAACSVVMLVFPKDGIKITDTFTLQFITFEDLFFEEEIEYADISHIIELDADSLMKVDEIDSIMTFDTLRANADSLRNSIFKLQYPNNNKQVLYPFFKDLDKLLVKKEHIRLLHYGDSQIEGDRISAYVRNKLQNIFGGTGVGLVPIIEISPRFTLDQIASDNWRRYTVFGEKDTTVKHNRYGMLMSFCRFTPIINDTVWKDTIEYSAHISFKQRPSSYKRNKTYTSIKMFYGYNKQPVVAELFLKDQLLSADTLPANAHFNIKSWKIDQDPEEITIKLRGKDSPDIYGVALNSDEGIFVDNIPMRGCAGTIFTKTDLDLLKRMYDTLHVELLIMQFGGNVIPYIKDKQGCINYGRWFRSQLVALKKIKDDLSIIVIGVADMSMKKKGRFITYPLLKEVRDELKKASFDAGCAYWDMYEAMGGENSMVSWVFAEPPLASKDYTHFSPRGALILAEIFYKALIQDYYEYKKKTAP